MFSSDEMNLQSPVADSPFACPATVADAGPAGVKGESELNLPSMRGYNLAAEGGVQCPYLAHPTSRS